MACRFLFVLFVSNQAVIPQSPRISPIQVFKTIRRLFSVARSDGFLFVATFEAPQYRLPMASSKENSEPKERLPAEAETWERERANKCRGKRELHTIEMETYENDNTESGPWVTFMHIFSLLHHILTFGYILQEIKGKNKKSDGNSKIKCSLKSDSLDQELPSTSKEASPALSGDGDTSVGTGSSNSELFDRKKPTKDQINFFSGNPFVEKVQGILHFYKEKYVFHFTFAYKM